MNHDDTGLSQDRRGVRQPPDADAREIARLLPAPDVDALSPERHRHHKELLMNLIDHDTAEQAGTTTVTSGTSGPGRSPRRRFLRPALLVPVSAFTLAGVVITAVAVAPGPDRPTTSASPASGGTGHGGPALLHRISAVALRTGVPAVRDDQFLYTRSTVRGADLTSGKAVVGPPEEREEWAAQDPRPLKKLGLIRTGGETFAINAELGDTEGTPAGLSRPTYAWLGSLPTDPEKLLTYLYAHTPESPDQERAQAVFDRIGELLTAVMPAPTAAALYEAAARLPGVVEAPQAADALGRHGLGIAREDTRYGTRTEWVFDRTDLSFLGSRSYLTEDTSYGEAGTLLSGLARTGWGVVDRAGELPAKTAGERQTGQS
ncbi:CU044_5270 family protein [Streptomyces sp. NBC_00247]|uniref:CU044_5270 family protein n=1 Tax=Streptomyces sp. NBC_00247 TaxID=2975689 RepID=UPI002E2D3BEA|nr:CU044_5270 family protein [Streptomyces sp. NBC_00247]